MGSRNLHLPERLTGAFLLTAVLLSLPGAVTIAEVDLSPEVLAFIDSEYVEINRAIPLDIAEGLAAVDGMTSAPMYDAQAISWASDRDAVDQVLRRIKALHALLLEGPASSAVASVGATLDAIAARALTTSVGTPERLGLFRELCAVRRRLSFANPLLDFDEVLFISASGGVGGFFQDVLTAHTTGGSRGLQVVANWKAATPAVRPLIAPAEPVRDAQGTPVPNTTASRVSRFDMVFDLSFDGDSILFVGEFDGYRILRVNRDGTNLRVLNARQDLREGHPCWLPGGRVVYASQAGMKGDRCGGRVSTLYSMAPDGSDSYPISFHETHDYHPVVDNNGMLVYSRWDYVDRSFHAAHNLWYCFPDGRDPRANHGNYPLPHSTTGERPSLTTGYRRPTTELFIRPVPEETGKYVAVAGVHHNPLPGIPVIIDTKIPDDDNGSQVRIIHGAGCYPNEYNPQNGNAGRWTQLPDRRTHSYIAPWPLSANFYLVSDQYNILLLDRFGNRELIYKWADKGEWSRSKEAAGYGTCQYCSIGFVSGPRPFRSRAKPPALPVKTWQGKRAGATDHQRAVISVTNVYESDLPFPAGTKIKYLRVFQVTPRNATRYPTKILATDGKYGTYYGDPDDGGMTRMSLGAVPVEDDGSAYFEAPVGKAIYFQALDSLYMCVQSMRSVTYVHPGEHLTCVGCHEDKYKVPSPLPPRKALARAPSRLTPEPGGVEPAGYYRLVKPVFDNTCLKCHVAEGRGLPDFSYDVLKDKVWWLYAAAGGGWSSTNHGGFRSVPGKFGARASVMGQALLATHRPRLTDDEFRRVMLWLDAGSYRLGAFAREADQVAGKLVWPDLEVDTLNPTGVEYFPGDDTSPPTAVQNLRAVPTGADGVYGSRLTWGKALDDESGVRGYNVCRDGATVAYVTDTAFVEGGLAESQKYTYTVSATNRSGWEGPKTTTNITSSTDTSAPRVTAVWSTSGASRLLVLQRQLGVAT